MIYWACIIVQRGDTFMSKPEKDPFDGIDQIIDRRDIVNANNLDLHTGIVEASKVAAIVWIAGFLLLDVADVSMTLASKIVVVTVISFVAGSLVTMIVAHRNMQKRMRQLEEQQEIDEAERRRKMKEAKDTGAFDRWEK